LIDPDWKRKAPYTFLFLLATAAALNAVMAILSDDASIAAKLISVCIPFGLMGIAMFSLNRTL
jgi:hypothetical protein